MLSLPLLLVLWQVMAMAVANPLLPSPVDVAAEMGTLASQGALLHDLGRTLGRVVAAFVLAMVLGTGIGIALGRARWADRLFSAWLVVGLNLPAIVVAILFYIWLGLTEWALVAAVVVNKLPMVAVTIREGVRSFADPYEELAIVSRLSWTRRLRFIYWPQLVPFVLASARAGLSLIWKIVLVFEVLGSDGGIGFRIAIFFQYFDVAGILAYTVSFVAVVLVFEYGVLRPLEGRLTRWRALPL
ncbi:MAG: ABC transporter permease subunit [Devosia sp.]|uniref:ABC transporter permease n=1 Tax=Devosia sp. TaxID=1871048 RepID=UPI0024C6CAD0|nr:ABC transporter permease subunit [Devosia sp.]UYN98211.1 MAG: ABC transporter permease subunit [Devosia sp.]